MKYLTAIVLLLSLQLPIFSAPAPFPKRERRESIAGHYHLDYLGNYHMILSSCGSYTAICRNDHARVWRGNWKIEDGKLVVTETQKLDAPPDFKWQLPLKCERIKKIK